MTLTIMFILILSFCIFCIIVAWDAKDKQEETMRENSVLRVERDLFEYHYRRMKARVEDKETKVDAKCLKLWDVKKQGGE